MFTVNITSPTDFRLPLKGLRFATEQGVVVIGRGKLGQRQRQAYEVAAAAQNKAIESALEAVQAHQIKLDTSNPVWTDSLIDQLDEVKA